MDSIISDEISTRWSCCKKELTTAWRDNYAAFLSFTMVYIWIFTGFFLHTPTAKALHEISLRPGFAICLLYQVTEKWSVWKHFLRKNPRGWETLILGATFIFSVLFSVVMLLLACAQYLAVAIYVSQGMEVDPSMLNQLRLVMKWLGYCSATANKYAALPLSYFTSRG